LLPHTERKIEGGSDSEKEQSGQRREAVSVQRKGEREERREADGHTKERRGEEGDKWNGKGSSRSFCQSTTTPSICLREIDSSVRACVKEQQRKNKMKDLAKKGRSQLPLPCFLSLLSLLFFCLSFFVSVVCAW